MNTPSRPVRFISSAALVTVSALTLSAAAIGASTPPEASDPAGSACWTDQPGVVGAIDHPTGPEAIVLQMLVSGGFLPVEVAFMQNPTFTLYGNDVAIFRTGDASVESIYSPLRPFACARLSPDQVDDLVALALDEGGLRDARDDYPNPNITDVPSTTFTIDADGVAKTVVVQGLGFDEQAPDAEARAAFTSLATALDRFQPEGVDAQPFDTPLYRSMLTKAWPELEGTPVAWPWDDVAPVDFGADLDKVVDLKAAQVSAVTTVPNGGQPYILLETPDGESVALTISPILPPAR